MKGSDVLTLIALTVFAIVLFVVRFVWLLFVALPYEWLFGPKVK